MCVRFNLSLASVKASFQDKTITNLLESVKTLFIEDVGVMVTDLVTFVVVKKFVFHQINTK